MMAVSVNRAELFSINCPQTPQSISALTFSRFLMARTGPQPSINNAEGTTVEFDGMTPPAVPLIGDLSDEKY